MMKTIIKLLPDQIKCAEDIQKSIDSLGIEGGEVSLPMGEFILDRGLELHTNVILSGQGKDTILKKSPGKIFPLSGYHNYGMKDIPLKSSKGLEVGMTVSIHDSRSHGGFSATFARITWIEDNWVGIDQGIEADYLADHDPVLTTVFPLVFGHKIANASLRNLMLDGNLSEDPVSIGGCRGGAVYFANSRDIEVNSVIESNFHGEGLSFQMCRDMRIINSEFSSNSGNGLHPGAGSTNVLFKNCKANHNSKAGFFFCVRANRISVENCIFEENEIGISVGTRDCFNIVEKCSIKDNKGPGILFRRGFRPVEVHSCLFNECVLIDNALNDGEGQIVILGHNHSLVFSNNKIENSEGNIKPTFYLDEVATNIIDEDNEFINCESSIKTTESIQNFDCSQWGYGNYASDFYRHLDVPN